MARILIVDDEYSVRSGFAMALRLQGVQAECEADPRKALERLGTESFDAMILDLRMPEMNGLKLAHKQAERNIVCPTILASAISTKDEVVFATVVGIVDFLSKPVSLSELREAVARVLDRQTQFAQMSVERIKSLPHALQLEAARYYLQKRDRRQAVQILEDMQRQQKDKEVDTLLELIRESESLAVD